MLRVTLASGAELSRTGWTSTPFLMCGWTACHRFQIERSILRLRRGSRIRAFEPYDNACDATSLPLIRAAIEILGHLPVGIQELNVALGGTPPPKSRELEGRMDHRALNRKAPGRSVSAIQHPGSLNPNSCLRGNPEGRQCG